IGLPESARDAAYAALRLAGQIEDPYEIACMHLTLARTLMYEGNFDYALTSVRRAHETCSAGGWPNKAARAKIAEGIILSKKRDYELARNQLFGALELLSQSPDRLDEALALNELGRVMRQLDDLPDAVAHLERARSLLEQGDVLEQAFNERETGICLSRLGHAEAEMHLRRAFDLYRASGASDDLAATCKALGDLYLSRGDTTEAISILQEGLEYIEFRSQ
ncbi:MAG TPA: tetratricopeptide repeat protein, partial [Actinomycetota bacterium]|nr:tetratricopeptide repeat protein [Actinomycetota bacterium]